MALILEVTAVPSPACLGLSLESREALVLGCSVSAQGKWLLFLWLFPWSSEFCDFLLSPLLQLMILHVNSYQI